MCERRGEEVRDALVMVDVPKQLVERLEKKPQEIGPNCLFENAESILRFYEEDIVLYVVRHEVKDKCVYKILQSLRMVIDLHMDLEKSLPCDDTTIL